MEVGFFSFDDLPELSQCCTSEKHLKEVHARIADPNRTSAFD